MNTRFASLLTGVIAAVSCLSITGCSLLIQPNENRLNSDGAVMDRTMIQSDAMPDTIRDNDVQSVDQPSPDVVQPDVVQPDVVVLEDAADVPSNDVRSNCIAGCNDGVGCTDDRCNEATGTCIFAPNSMNCAMGQVCNPNMGGCVVQNCMIDDQCNDNNMCNGREVCRMGVCQGGAPLVCNDNNMCNGVETCDNARGCVMGVPLRCDDGLYCNGQETCDNARGCIAGPPIPCDDGIACTTDSCNEGADRCDNIANPMACPAGQVCSIARRMCIMQGCQNDNQCSDGNVCNGMERCDMGNCVPGMALNCNDNNMCNGVETCDRVNGCQPGMPLQCDDRQFCNGSETCAPATGCQRGPAPTCNDNNPCTNDFCNNMANGGAGGCVSTLVDADGDGAPARMVNGVACPLGTDCNDMSAAIRPGAMEICNNIDDNCNGMIDEGLMCAGPPANDLCANSTAINLSAGTLRAVVNGTTLLSTDNVMTTCAGVGGGDVFYTINYPSGYDLRVEVAPNGGGDPVLGIRADCGGVTLGCNDDQRRGNVGPRMWVRDDGRAAAGARRAVVIVDSYQRGNEGAFILTATIAPAVGYGACRAGAFDLSAGGTVLANPPPVMGTMTANCAPIGAGFLAAGEDVYTYAGANNGARITLNATFRPLLSTRDAAMCMNPMAERQCAVGNGPGQLQFNAGQSNAVIVDGLPQPGAGAGASFYSLELLPF
jgi:hypothetical protein